MPTCSLAKAIKSFRETATITCALDASKSPEESGLLSSLLRACDRATDACGDAAADAAASLPIAAAAPGPSPSVFSGTQLPTNTTAAEASPTLSGNARISGSRPMRVHPNALFEPSMEEEEDQESPQIPAMAASLHRGWYEAGLVSPPTAQDTEIASAEVRRRLLRRAASKVQIRGFRRRYRIRSLALGVGERERQQSAAEGLGVIGRQFSDLVSLFRSLHQAESAPALNQYFSALPHPVAEM